MIYKNVVQRNLQKYGATEAQMIEVSIQQIRSVAEMACPVWNWCRLQEVTSLEQIQRTAMAVIRGENHTNYREALEHFKIKNTKRRTVSEVCNQGLQKPQVLQIVHKEYM